MIGKLSEALPSQTAYPELLEFALRYQLFQNLEACLSYYMCELKLAMGPGSPLRLMQLGSGEFEVRKLALVVLVALAALAAPGFASVGGLALGFALGVALPEQSLVPSLVPGPAIGKRAASALVGFARSG
ncbi:hypothetical protein AK830_g3953 [Neonectria ditissima]|uniref:Uncharacterized protein n=1 Tax=Neonectria ditissima TaxID=78410 RepID=A0A0P7BPV8_9HYPO|nr:hypothetical protein AK830_g3953 [Neonectria ditissima]